MTNEGTDTGQIKKIFFYGIDLSDEWLQENLIKTGL